MSRSLIHEEYCHYLIQNAADVAGLMQAIGRFVVHGHAVVAGLVHVGDLEVGVPEAGDFEADRWARTCAFWEQERPGIPGACRSPSFRFQTRRFAVAGRIG